MISSSADFQLDVLLPFHRIDKHLYKAIKSTLESMNVEVNLILIDDRSAAFTDVPSFALSPNVTYVRTSGNCGYGESLRYGSKYLKAEFLALMNSDDLSHPLRFSTQLSQIGNADINICKMRRISSRGYPSISVMGNPRRSYSRIMLGFGAIGADATWLMRTKWWRENAFFDDEPCLDWRIALSAFGNSNITFSPYFLYSYRRHAAQTSRLRMSEFEIEKLYLKWAVFMESCTGKNLGLEAFHYLATPWIRRSNLPALEIWHIEKLIIESAKNLSATQRKEIKLLLRRRRLIHFILLFLDKLKYNS